ncbi:MAG: 2-C-methyl-D-erythritol 4-phosphate cytidylyltransferase [Candidatus Cryptobacteroides sp.]|nr:2-C-methyl-D-erythritol 4-phosphate cytidylyltransferase [Candidatus Cryptobacteroides sp.]
MARDKYVIIMAAGRGSRMGEVLPKQFIEIDSEAILMKTIRSFEEACPEANFITVLPSDWIPYWRDYCLKHNLTTRQALVAGGITRFHSVRNALDRVPDGALVAVHDGVRPLASAKLINDAFRAAEKYGAAIPVVPCVDTLRVLEKKTAPDGTPVLVTVEGAKADRSVLYGVQTPQVFHSEILKEAYRQPYDTDFTDDASVVQKDGKNLSYIAGERFNIKITTKDDLFLAKAILSYFSSDSRKN